MSWSFYAIGKPRAVLESARKQLSAIKCAEPEETIKGKFLSMLEASMLVMPDASAVRIEANGSQSARAAGEDGRFTNSFSAKIEPLYGFVE